MRKTSTLHFLSLFLLLLLLLLSLLRNAWSQKRNAKYADSKANNIQRTDYKSINTLYLDKHIEKIRYKFGSTSISTSDQDTTHFCNVTTAENVEEVTNGDKNCSASLEGGAEIAASKATSANKASPTTNYSSLLTPTNYPTSTSSSSSSIACNDVAPKIFLLVYADWCNECMQAKKDFNDLYINEGFDNIFFKINIEINRELKYRFDINSYPTFLILDAVCSKYYKFEGNRTYENLAMFWKEAQNFTNLATNKSVTFSHISGVMRESLLLDHFFVRVLKEMFVTLKSSLVIGFGDLLYRRFTTVESLFSLFFMSILSIFLKAVYGLCYKQKSNIKT